ncbi:unnamed protein product [Rhodiola kirilowii]
MHFCFRIILLLTTPQLIFNFSVGSPPLGRALRSRINHVVHPDDQSVSPLCTPLYFLQTLDHFNSLPESYHFFNQKFFMVDKHWRGSMFPIFVFLEGEQSLLEYQCSEGFMLDTADTFHPLMLFVEHRYYGDSIPFNSREETFRNASTLGYLNSAQALADIAEIIISVKTNYSAHDSPVIVFGGSYAGNLAAWMRLKYPHLVLGALASSAPLLYFDGVTPKDGYDKVLSRDFKEISENCYKSIKQSWDMIDEVAVEVNGLSALSRQFHTCSKLDSSLELKYYLKYHYIQATQYGAFSIVKFCKIVDEEGSSPNSNLLDSIAHAVAGAIGNNCLDDNVHLISNDQAIINQVNYFAWGWQSCIDQVMPMGHGNDTIFQPGPFNWTEFKLRCKMNYGVPPRPHWATKYYYGGRDPKLVLRRFASNIIFSNGLRDPYSSGGVLEDLSDTLVAITAKEGHHCFDLYSIAPRSKWEWEVRVKEVQIIKSWLHKYYRHLEE